MRFYLVTYDYGGWPIGRSYERALAKGGNRKAYHMQPEGGFLFVDEGGTVELKKWTGTDHVRNASS